MSTDTEIRTRSRHHRMTSWPLASVEVTFSKFLPRYAVNVIGGNVVAGSREALALQLFRENRMTRPRIRGLRNPSRSSKRTDFGRRLP